MRSFGQGIAALSEWIRDGRLVLREQVETGGVAAFGTTLNLLFEGANTGKLVLQVGAGQE